MVVVNHDHRRHSQHFPTSRTLLLLLFNSIQFNSAQTPDTRHSRWSYAARPNRLFSVCWRKTQNLNYFWVKFLRQSSVLELPDQTVRLTSQSVSVFFASQLQFPFPLNTLTNFEHLLPAAAANRQTLMRQLMGGNRVLSQTHSFNRLWLPIIYCLLPASWAANIYCLLSKEA